MVLAISLVGLVSSLALYLMMGSNNAYKTSKTIARHESALNLAEAALQLSLRCIRRSAPSPNYTQLTSVGSSSTVSAITSGLPSYITSQTAGIGTLTPAVDYVGVQTVPPAGWMLNWQGYSSFYGVYYRPRGSGVVALPSSQGNATATVSVLAEKVTR